MQVTVLETHKKMQPVIETKTLPKSAKYPHKSIKFYDHGMQFISKPIDLPLSAVTLHYYRMISAAANKTELPVLLPVCSDQKKIRLSTRK